MLIDLYLHFIISKPSRYSKGMGNNKVAKLYTTSARHKINVAK